MKRKIFAALLTIAMISSVTACGSVSKKQENSPTSAVNTTTSEEATTSEKIDEEETSNTITNDNIANDDTTNNSESANNETTNIVESTSEETTTIKETTTTNETTTTSKETTKQPETTSKKEEQTTKEQQTTTSVPPTTTVKPTTTKQPETTIEEETTTMSQKDIIKAMEKSAEFKAVANNDVYQGNYYAWYEDKYLPNAKITIPAGLYLIEPGRDMDAIFIVFNTRTEQGLQNDWSILDNNTDVQTILEGYLNIGYLELEWLLSHKYEP